MTNESTSFELSTPAPELQRYRIRGRLDLTQIAELDASVPLRVAAVRNHQILESQVIPLNRDDKAKVADFDLTFALPGRRCGVQFIVSRGDIPPADILGLEGVTQRIAATQWQVQDKQGRESDRLPLVADLGQLVIPERIYRYWFIFCRRYVIRGRVVCRRWRYNSTLQQWVFVDEPVPGATVEAHDVDCWWWWCFKDLISTAVTGPDGTFEMSFSWCCRSWFPFRAPWIVDPDLLARIRKLLAEARSPLGPLPPNPPVDPAQFQDYLVNVLGAANTEAATAALRAGFPTPEAAPGLQTSAASLKALLPQAPDLEALHVWPWWNRRDCAPDITFRATQLCNGEVRVIYEESTSQTRWNSSSPLEVTLEANDAACCLPTPDDSPCGDCLVIKRVGCGDPGGILIDDIGTSAGPPDLRGYAYPNTLDRPFGGTLPVLGDFGEDAHPILDFYRVEYRKEGMPAGTWFDAGSVPTLLRPISRRYWDWTAVAFSPNVQFGPTEVAGQQVYKTRYKYERDNPGLPGGDWIWTNRDRLFIVDSEQLPEGDGLYTFRVVGYRQAPDGSLVDERVMPLCGTIDQTSGVPATLMLRIDNRSLDRVSTPESPCGPGTVTICTSEPHCDFVSVVKNEGSSAADVINACDFATISDSDTVTIHFKVTTPATATDAHLQQYQLTAHYAESAVFNVLTAGTLAGDPTPEYGPTYAQALAQGAVRPFWSGGSFKVTLPGSAFPQSCAYQFRLRTWKRTSNGCTSPQHFHWNRCEFSFCVIKQ